MKNNTRRLIKFLVITFSITWISWLADALLIKFTNFSWPDVLPMILFTVGGFGPTIAALLCLEGGFSMNKLKRILFKGNRGSLPFIFAALILETAAFFISSDGLNKMIPRSPVAIIAMLIIFLQSALLFGGNEEIGWRGTMLPILQEKIPATAAALITAIVWVCWHIPLWFIEGDPHQGSPFLFFAILGIALSFWLSAVYNFTGALIFCMILHGWTNTLLGIFVIRYDALFYITIGALTLLSVLVSIRAEHSKGKKLEKV